MASSVKIKPYWGPVGGWGSAGSVAEILLREGIALKGPLTLVHQNKPSGYQCVSCSYAKPGDPHQLEFCENGAKATAWEITAKRCGPEFFAEHTVTELETWSDHDLEKKAASPTRCATTPRATNTARSDGRTLLRRSAER